MWSRCRMMSIPGRWCVAGLFMVLLTTVGMVSCQASTASTPALTSRGQVTAPSPVTVAFLGDQGLGEPARRVLQLVKQVGAELVVHAGDLDYRDDPEAWERQITAALGADFPYLVAIGNHDVSAWDGYRAVLEARLQQTPLVVCQGALGVQSICTYKGLSFVLSGVGTQGEAGAHVAYLQTQLAQATTDWRVCVWHKNRQDLQVGRKRNDVPLAAYEVCRLDGAMVVTAHSHTYSRTHLLDNFASLRVASTSNPIRLEPGQSIAVVTGLGGKSVRPQKRDGPWWASIYTRDQGADFGALFCTFYWQGQVDRARCWFQAIDGAIPDTFDLVNGIEASW